MFHFDWTAVMNAELVRIQVDNYVCCNAAFSVTSSLYACSFLLLIGLWPAVVYGETEHRMCELIFSF